MCEKCEHVDFAVEGVVHLFLNAVTPSSQPPGHDTPPSTDNAPLGMHPLLLCIDTIISLHIVFQLLRAHHFFFYRY